jgi:D-alanyl-D-alanine carboxypeptidase
MVGKHRRARLTSRGRRIAVAGTLAVLAIGGVVASTALRGPAAATPQEVCAHPPTLQTWQGVRLQPAAMTSFRAAQQEAGVQIPVVQSYRSCHQQRIACRNICGNPNGCEGTCAPPGLSWHQLGEAVDITQAGLDDARIPRALEDNGWCQAVPDTDPGHFSFDGCH